MKIIFGGTKRMTIGNKPYEPIMAESNLTIEREYDREPLEEEVIEMQEKVNRILDKDLDKKVTETLKLQQKSRNKMSDILRGL
jgi:hypothetical protein